MPTYQYACTECGHQLEAVQSFADEPLTECPACEGRLRKLFNSVGIVFKGSGFYRTDSRTNGSEGADAGSAPAKSESSKGSDSGSSPSGGDSGSTTGGSGSGSGSGSTGSGGSGSANGGGSGTGTSNGSAGKSKAPSTSSSGTA